MLEHGKWSLLAIFHPTHSSYKCMLRPFSLDKTVSLQIHLLKPQPECDGIWTWCLWKGLRLRLGHEVMTPMMGSVPL